MGDLLTRDCSPRSLPRNFSPSSMMRALYERPQPGRRRSVSINHRSTLSHFASSFLILTTVLLTLCSPAVATPDSTCALTHIDTISHSNSHSFILGRRVRRDEINEISIDPRQAPNKEPHLEQQHAGHEGQPLKSSDGSKPSAQENAQENVQKNGREPDTAHDDSPNDPSSNSNPTQDESSESSKGDSPSATTSTRDESSITTTSTTGGRTITATGTLSAGTEIQTAAPIGSDNPLPTAFDTSLGGNYTGPNCLNFFHEFLNNSTFIDCHPMSLLIQDSMSFYRDSSSAASISQILDASCAASESTCTGIMTNLASQLTDDSNCGEDFKQEQPIVTRAYLGLISYGAIYKATCLKNPETNSYCYVDAATNTSNPSDSYVYSIPLGLDFPGGERPSCNGCLQATMEIFADTARVEGQALADTYLPAAQLINMRCGPDFVNTTVQVGTLPAIDAAPGSLLRSSSTLMGYVSFLSAGVMLFSLY